MNSTCLDWEVVPFQHVVKQVIDFRGRTPLKIGMDWGGGEILSLSANNVRQGYIDVTKEAHLGSEELYAKWMTKGDCEEGDIVFTMEAPLGNVAQVPDNRKYILSQRVVLLKINRSIASNTYIAYLMRSEEFQQKLVQRSTGSTVTGIQQQKLNKFEMLLPPVKQQQKIAKILSTVDNLIEKTQTLIDKYTAIKQGMMTDLFTRGIDMTTGDTPNSKGGKLRPSVEDAPELYKQTELGWVPKEWEVKLLGDISTVSSGITLGNEYSGSDAVEVPYLRVANVQDGYLDLSEVKAVKIPPSHVAKYLLEAGDVLMNEGGDFDKLGRGTIWDGEVEGCCHQNHVFKVRAHRPELFPEYLAYWSASSFGKSYFIMNSKQSTNLASINSSQLKRFPVLVPSIEEQQKILYRLSAIDGNISKLKLNIDKNNRIKKGLMQDLLTGKVKVA